MANMDPGICRALGAMYAWGLLPARTRAQGRRARQTPKWLYGTMGFVGAGVAGDFFCLAYGKGKLFCLTLCVYTQNTQNFVENSQTDDKHKKGF